MKTYRKTHTNNPMSDYGHAMFTDEFNKLSDGYGSICWQVDNTELINIESLMPQIKIAWINTCEVGYYYRDINNDIQNMIDNCTLEQILNSFNPVNIVTSADAYDSLLVCWLYEYVIEPNNIYGIKTYDGAIVFNSEIIERYYP